MRRFSFRILKKNQIWMVMIGLGFIFLIVYQSFFNAEKDIDDKIERQLTEIKTLMGNYRLRIDDKLPLNGKEFIGKLLSENSNLPETYFKENFKILRHYKNRSCAIYPSMFDIEFDSIYWQSLKISNGTFHFLNAYLDDRPDFYMNPSVRIMAMINRVDIEEETYCQLWFDSIRHPIIVQSNYTFIWYKNWGTNKHGIFYSYIVTCPIPEKYNHLVPSSVSVVEKPCDFATNNIRVINNKPKVKKKFAVCVKGLDFYFDDISVRIIEWLELLFLLGADKVFFYRLQIHPNISKVLDYYERLGKVDVTPITLPGGQPNMPVFQHLFLKKNNNLKRRNEILPYNDCLYKNFNSYEYIILLDIDEIIIPVQDPDWSSLMERIKEIRDGQVASYDSYNVRNVYFLDDLQHDHGWFSDIPIYMHMLQHVYRTKNFTQSGYYIKCFHDTQKVLALHNHFPFACIDDPCVTYSVETEDAQLQHYRSDCVSDIKNCKKLKNETVMDTTIWRYKDELVPNVLNTLIDLGFIDLP